MYLFRLFYIPVIIIFLIFSCTDKELKAQSVEIGLIGGTNISSHVNNFRFSEGDINLDLTPEMTIGYQAGLIARKAIGPSWRFQAEPTLILLGAKYNESFTLRGFDIQTDSKTELLYLQLPLLLQLTSHQPKQKVYGDQKAVTTYHLSGGIFGGYLLDAEFSGTNSGAPFGVPFQDDFTNGVSSQYSDYDGGVILGVGFEHGLDKKIGLEARAMYSVLDSGNASQLAFEPHNMSASLAVYFMF
jgi:hypothetical protein